MEKDDRAVKACAADDCEPIAEGADNKLRHSGNGAGGDRNAQNQQNDVLDLQKLNEVVFQIHK